MLFHLHYSHMVGGQGREICSYLLVTPQSTLGCSQPVKQRNVFHLAVNSSSLFLSRFGTQVGRAAVAKFLTGLLYHPPIHLLATRCPVLHLHLLITHLCFVQNVPPHVLYHLALTFSICWWKLLSLRLN